jgi:hypothetical protein
VLALIRKALSGVDAQFDHADTCMLSKTVAHDKDWCDCPIRDVESALAALDSLKPGTEGR